MPQAVIQRVLDGIYYNIPIGPMERGLTTVATYKAFEKAENLTPENIRLANILGWAMELVGISKLQIDI